MSTTTLSRRLSEFGTLEMKGEEFVVLKKEYLDELLTITHSFDAGEKLLKTGKTRSFSEFFKNLPRKR